MIITLNPDWRIRSDPLQWIVDQRHVRKPGTSDEYEEWVVWGYFSTLAGAVNSTVGVMIRSMDGDYPNTALGPLLAALGEIRESVDDVLGSITGVVQLVKPDGTLSTIIQASDRVMGERG